MSFSELEAISGDAGLDWDKEKMCLRGSLNGYPVCIRDDPERREYLFTVFFRTRPDRENDLTEGINRLLEHFPSNCVKSRRKELNYQQINFNAALLYQENSVLIPDFIKNVCELADGLDLLPQKLDEKIAAPDPPAAEKKLKKPKNAVSKRFDKYSIRGLAGALIGGIAITVISSLIIDNSPSNIGGMLSSWSAGAFISLIILADYSFLAKKMDVFGTLICSFLTAVSCFFSAYFAVLKALTDEAGILDPSITINDTMWNWSYYQMLFPSVTGDFPILLVKNLFTAVVFSAVFYIFYFRRHQAIMYSEGGDIMPEENEKKKKNP